MRTFSISKILIQKKRRRIISLLIVLVLLIGTSSFLFLRNPKKTGASSWNPSTSTLIIDTGSCSGTLTLYGDDSPTSGVKQRFGVSGGTCAGITNSTINLDFALYPNLNIIITGKTVVMQTEPNKPFKAFNFTINAGGMLTHDYLSTTDYDGTTWILNSNGARKKVDLQLAHNLFINDTGKIDVSQRGYRFPTGPGQGPGGTAESTKASSGAGYGGRGGMSFADTNPGGSVYPTTPDASQLTTLWHGSSSGLANGTLDDGLGANGGGIIQLRIGDQLNISGATSPSILANGAPGDTSWSGVCSGGGSGGSIRIIFDAPQTSFQPSPDVLGGITDGNAEDGQAGTIHYSGITLAGGSAPNIQARGGSISSGGNEDGGGGGGGRIALYGAESIPFGGGSSSLITKTLTPISRNNVPNTSFNPYALQIGDIVQVTLNATNISSINYYFKDPLLQTPGVTGLSAHICEPVTGTANPPWDIRDGNELVWTGTTANKTVSYQCKVQ